MDKCLMGLVLGQQKLREYLQSLPAAPAAGATPPQHRATPPGAGGGGRGAGRGSADGDGFEAAFVEVEGDDDLDGADAFPAAQDGR